MRRSGDVLAGDALADDALAGDVLAGDALAGDALAGEALDGEVLPAALPCKVLSLSMRSLYSSTDSRIGFGRDITADSTLAMTSAGGMRGPTAASAGKGCTLTTLPRHGAIRVSFIGAGVAGPI